MIMNPTAATLALLSLLSVARAAPITTRRKGFLGGRRGARIGFIVGMVVLGIILASIAFWCLLACCCASASSRRRGPGFIGRRAPPMGTTSTTAAPISTTTGLHPNAHAPAGGYAAPPAGAGPTFPQPAHQGI